MALSDIKIRSLRPGPKPRKVADGRGLFLLIQPSGAKLWRLKYRIRGKERKLSLGQYPDVTLREARNRCDHARVQLAAGTDPFEAKHAAVSAREEHTRNAFKVVAYEYLERAAREGRASVTIKKSQWLLTLLLPDLADRAVGEIKPAELLRALRRVEDKGNYETARRMRSLASRIFRYAVATSRAEHDPSALLRGALIVPRVKHHSAILEPQALGALLRAIDGYQGQPLSRSALKLAPHVFVRPGELRRAEWLEFDLDQGIWTIPAEKMKMRRPHLVPLSRQVLEILRATHALRGRQRFVFSSMYPGNRPMSENTINAALRRLGYNGTEMTAHGFRSTACSLLNESGRWNPDAIERALAHSDSNAVRATYHRGQHWDERVRMAQWWSDYLDELKADTPHLSAPERTRRGVSVMGDAIWRVYRSARAL